MKLDVDMYFINLCRAHETLDICYGRFTLVLDILLSDGVITSAEYRFLKRAADVIEFPFTYS